MQPSPLSTKPLGVLVLLLIIGGILLFFSVHTYNKTLYIQQQQNQENAPPSQLDIIPISVHDPIQGSKTAPITIIGFEDFLCEACRVQHKLISDLLDKYDGQVKFIWKDLSITAIPTSSEMIHVYGYCMNEQGRFDAFKDIIFSNVITSVNQSLLDTIATEAGANMSVLQTCVESEAPYSHIDKNKQLARALQIQSTPTFFVHGSQIITPSSLLEWEQIVVSTGNNR